MIRDLKDSGFKWLGKIPMEWQVSRIGNCYTERNTKVSDVDYQPLSVTMKGIVPQLSTAAKTDSHDDRKLVEKGDFAINSRSDRRGSCGISDYEGSVSLINTILQPRGKMNPQYYNWLFHTSMFADEFYKWGHGIVDDLWTTNWQDMKRIAIPSPSLEEQQRIADFLDRRCAEIDSIITKTEKTIDEYKALKQSIITEAVTKGIRPNRPMKDSGVEWIGIIPDEWICKKAKYCIEISNGADPKTEGNIPVYGSGAKSFKTCGEFKNGPTVLLGRKGATLHIPHYVQGKYWNVDTAFDVKTKPDFSLEYYYYLACCFDYKFYISQTTLPGMTQTNYENMFLPVPSLSEQQEIVNILKKKCGKLDFIISIKQELISELETYRKSVIYEYVTGKKEVVA